ncbi:MAG: T9SS type A sorting domain-containing protein [Candidatus Kapabacteria bacterium]|nr:T9SS type A sorting domain-containing protein [Candidatus Kapabacteria bacterium]
MRNYIIRCIVLSSLLILLALNSTFSQQVDTNWKSIYKQQEPLGNHFDIIQCADSLNCIILCDYGGQNWAYNFRLTTDGGKNWDVVYGDSSYYKSPNNYYNICQIRDIAYPSSKLFIAVGDTGTIIRSTDQGKSWKKTILSKDLGLYKVKMLNDKYGVMRAGFYSKPLITFYETHNGGDTWKERNIPDEYKKGYFNDYQIINDTTMYAVRIFTGINVFFAYVKATDNWMNWDTLRLDNILYPKIKPDLFYLGLNFIDENYGWVYGGRIINDSKGYDSQLILYTTNGGKDWSIQRDTNLNNFTIGPGHLIMYDKNYGIACAGPYVTLMTSNGGKTWDRHYINEIDTNNYSYILYSLQMPAPNWAYAISTTNEIFRYHCDLKPLEVVIEKPILKSSNYPNPFSEKTEISYYLQNLSFVKISIFDVFGVEKDRLKEDFELAGIHKIKYVPKNLSSGSYFCKIEADGRVQILKMSVIK